MFGALGVHFDVVTAKMQSAQGVVKETGTHHIIVEYTADGIQYQIPLSLGDQRIFSVGDKVTVYFKKSDPKTIYMQEGDRTRIEATAISVLIAGLLLAVVPPLYKLYAARKA